MVDVTRRPIWLGVAAVCWASTAVAQERPGSPYAIIGISLPRQSGPTGETSETYVTAPGGVTRGWFVGGGIVLTRAVSVEVELSSTGLMTAREPSRYFMTFNEERRDRLLTVAARLAALRAGAVRVEPVVGIVNTHPAAWSQTEYYRPVTQVTVVERKIEHHLDSSVGVAFGCDARVGGGRVAVVPSFRMAHTGVSHGVYGGSEVNREIGSIYPGGYPNWTIRSGVGVRVLF